MSTRMGVGVDGDTTGLILARPVPAATAPSRNQVDRAHYFKPRYDSKKRFASYWHQIQEVMAWRPAHVADVGVGNGFVSHYLRTRGVRVTGIDIDPHLGPTMVGDVRALPLADGSVDVLLCAEVLEHLPYGEIPAALREMRRVTRRAAVLTVPDATRFLRFLVGTARRWIHRVVTLPSVVSPVHVFDGQHYWEIGKRGTSLGRIVGDIQAAGWSLQRSYRIFDNPDHRILVLARLDSRTETIPG